MAKKPEQKLNYAAEIRALKEKGPQRLYLLYGPEDYLREQYLITLKKLCLPDGEDDFSYKRIDAPQPEVNDLRQAIDAMPFLSERTFVELRGLDLNHLKEPEDFIAAFADIPDYCTVVLILDTEVEPDGRSKLVKALMKSAVVLKFTEQDQSRLLDWIRRRFDAYGKSVDIEAARRLIFLCGELMNKLIPEIEKIAAFTVGDRVTEKEVNEIAVPVPDAVVFQMTDCIAERKYNNALDILHDLLARGEEPIAILAMLGMQIRRMYGGRLALENRLGAKYLMDTCKVSDGAARQIMRTAEKFSLKQLRRALVLIAEADYRMKSSGGETERILVDVILQIAVAD